MEHVTQKIVSGQVIILLLSGVLPFKIMAEVVYKTHQKLGHIGMDKLQHMVTKQFWHPAINKIVGDVCRSCLHCQQFKISRQHRKPPMYKINTVSPFELVSMDLLMLPQARTQVNTVLVSVDH